MLADMPKHSVCAEIGVYEGDFSESIIKIVGPKKLHLIDPWRFEESEVYKDSLYGGEKGRSQSHLDSIYEKVKAKFDGTDVVQIHRSSSADACVQFPEEYFDWIYIDANHQCEFVKGDLELYLRTVKCGGYLTGDDYGEGRWWQGGVKKAVDEFVLNPSVKLKYVRDRQFCLQKVKHETCSSHKSTRHQEKPEARD